jgi:hypothetical protein
MLLLWDRHVIVVVEHVHLGRLHEADTMGEPTRAVVSSSVDVHGGGA